MTTRQRLSAAFGALAFLVLVAALLGLNTASNSSSAFSRYVNGSAYRMELANSLLDATHARAIAARNLVLVSDNARLAVERRQVESAHQAVTERLAELRKSAAGDESPKVKELIEAIATVEAKYGPVALDIVDKAVKGEREAAIAKMNAECTPLLEALVKAAGEYLRFSTQAGHAEVNDAEQAYARAKLMLIGALLVALVGAAAMAVVIPRGLMRALGGEPADLAQIARNISDGDLSPLKTGDSAVRSRCTCSDTPE